MTILEKMIDCARNAKQRSRYFLAFTIVWIALCILPVRYFNQQALTSTPTQNIAALIGIPILFLIPGRFVARWATAPIRTLQCPKCGNARMYPKGLETFLASPDKFRNCAKCGADFGALG